MLRLIYAIVLLPVVLAAMAAAPFKPKLRAALSGRKGWRGGFGRALAGRDPGAPLVWFHVASAGEFLQAEPIMAALRGEGVQLAVTLSSPSGLKWLERIRDWPELVWSGLLPLDFPWNAARMLEGLRPAAMVYVQAELWPGLLMEARRRGVPQLLIAARIGRGVNYRARPPLSWLYRYLYGSLQAIACISQRDRRGIAEIVPAHPRLEVTGDPGIETVLRRLEEAPLPPVINSWRPRGAPLLVIGSSWPADEEVILATVRGACIEWPGMKVILAPHEPEEARLLAMEEALSELAPVRLSAAEKAEPPPECRVILVDSVGRLAALYKAGSIAYVGGGFLTGVHNVAEPAACGLPVIFGPRYGGSAVARALLEAGAAFKVSDSKEFQRVLEPLLTDKHRRGVVGQRAGGLIKEMAGAVETIRGIIADVVPGLGLPQK